MQINQTSIGVVHGSLLDQDVEAIVNAANQQMRGGGGIDGAIHDAAGPGLLEELKLVAPHGAKVGEAVTTGGHRMKQPTIIHTPGPVWSDSCAEKCAAELASCYSSCLQAAEAKELESIGFCSISTGIYGYPVAQAAPLAIATVIAYLRQHPSTTLRRVIFAMRSAPEFRAFEGALQDVSPA